MKPPKEPKSFRYPRLYWVDVGVGEEVNRDMLLANPMRHSQTTSQSYESVSQESREITQEPESRPALSTAWAVGVNVTTKRNASAWIQSHASSSGNL